MNIPSAKYLKLKAANRLASGKEPQKVVLTYAVISSGISLAVTAVRYLLADRISQTGGLQNIGMRSILSTADNVLPIVQMIVMMCLNLGYIAAMLRISRRQYASPKTLKAGAERFWPLLRTRLLLGLIYAGIAFASSYLALGVFMLTPLSNHFTDMALPLASAGQLTPEMLLNDDALMGSLMRAMMPMMYVYALILIPLLLTVSYRFRLTDYLLIDQPQNGAVYAIRQSRILMRGNVIRLFKIDLSFWWYFLLQFAVTGVLYLDVILGAFGIVLPISGAVSFFGCTVLYLAADFAMLYYLRNKLEVTYALAYTSLIPKETTDTGVVLGNIFNT